MRNDTSLKVTCVNNNHVDEFHFDYYNKEGNFVGTVMVDEKGRMKWYIFNKRDDDVFLLDQGVEKNILATVSYIYGEGVENNLEYVMKGRLMDERRWDRAQEYIFTKGLHVNYKNDQYYDTGYAILKRR